MGFHKTKECQRFFDTRSCIIRRSQRSKKNGRKRWYDQVLVCWKRMPAVTLDISLEAMSNTSMHSHESFFLLQCLPSDFSSERRPEPVLMGCGIAGWGSALWVRGKTSCPAVSLFSRIAGLGFFNSDDLVSDKGFCLLTFYWKYFII